MAVNEEVFEIVVKDGYRRVPIKNELGEEVGIFYFNPTDVGIIKRYEEVKNRFGEVTEPLKNIGINPDGTASEDGEIEALEQAENKLYELCNYLFGGDFAGAFFGKINPFSPIDGNFYCENALNVVSVFITEKFGDEAKKINKRVDKYTHGYKTGKHKDGKK